MAGRTRPWPPDPQPLVVPLIDNHTHLTHITEMLGDDDPGPAAHIERARGAGVDRMVQVGCDLDSARDSVELAATFEQIVAGVAIHPNEAPLHDQVRQIGPDGLEPEFETRHAVPLDDAIAEIADLARTPRVRAIAETGLDYFRTGDAGREAQQRSFRTHIALAKELNLPMQIHDRDAHGDVLDILDRDGAPPVTVLHCFSGDAEFARECIARGFYLSFAGTVTFKNAENLRAAARLAPASMMLVETDAPFLTPHPYRGAPNAPYVLGHTLRFLAELRGEHPDELGAQITETTEHIYGPW